MTKRVRHILRTGAIATIATSALAIAPMAATATPPIKLAFKLQPDKLGQGTTVSIGFDIPHSPGEIPSPLSEFDILLPPEMGLGSSTLGVETCSPQTLEGVGPSGCPVDAMMGFGSAVAEASLGVQVVNEVAPLSAYMAPASGGHTTLLYYFGGKVPVIAPLLFPSQFLATGSSPRSEFKLGVPAIPGLPGTPNAAIVGLKVALGPKDIPAYTKDVGGKVVHYKPAGMAVPDSCPKGGFPFGAHFVFEDGSHVDLTRTVPCPRASNGGHPHHSHH